MASSPLPLPDLSAPAHALERLPEEWAALLESWGEPRFRGRQVFQWIHQRGVFDPASMTSLPKTLRARLEAELADELAYPFTVHRRGRAPDRTQKLLLRVSGERDIETVLIPQNDGSVDPDVDTSDQEADRESGITSPVTQCISSQIGCAMGCVFCASGVAGLQRQLSAAEIVGQVLLGRQLLREDDEGDRLRNVVLMGMGEPLHNYDAVARALVLMTHPDGLGLSTRRVTLSTSGLVPQIDRLGRDFDGRIQLAISLHATSDERRSAIMPINRKYPLRELMACLRRYPLPKRRRITLEYTLIAGVNDALDEADALAALVRGVPVKVNLIPMNPIAESDLGAPDASGVARFRARLMKQGLTATVRRQRGDDIDAACGQLALYGPEGERTPRKRRLPLTAPSPPAAADVAPGS
ncbi:MAG: 23S rRNA (adenine(2503)-C(2))-methyltransferase RlmN [Myxococcota bacterium]